MVACTPSTTQVKPATEKPRASEQEALSRWQEVYGEAQEKRPNTLPHQATRPSAVKSSQVASVTDMWQQIRNNYDIPNPVTHPKIQAQLKWFVAHPEYVSRVVERARPYLYHIVRELEKRNMPLELALLPIVESGFKPYAYSSSHASGLWQFIPGTGKAYGLQQDWWYDGRRDVIASTQAALTYLQKLHGDFSDWQLALAAYNCGESAVRRAIKRNKKAGKPTDFWSLKLPKETSVYVPKLLAISHLISSPETFNITLSPIKNEPFFTVINTSSQIDLTIAAKLANMTLDEMYHLNPGFNRWATRPDGPHYLVIPLTKSITFQKALAVLPDKDRVQWTRHKVKSGQSLGSIAHYYKTNAAVLKKANGLHSNTIRAGHHLLIPQTSDHNKLAFSHPAQKQLSKQEIKSRTKKTHKVKAGDTWWDLAKAYNVDIKSLAKWNKKSPKDTLRIGQKLVILTDKNKVSSSKK